jgi:hypothetical protein
MLKVDLCFGQDLLTHMAWNIPKHCFMFGNAIRNNTFLIQRCQRHLLLNFFQYVWHLLTLFNIFLERKCSNCLTSKASLSRSQSSLETDFSWIQIGLKENNNKWTDHLFVCLNDEWGNKTLQEFVNVVMCSIVQFDSH